MKHLYASFAIQCPEGIHRVVDKLQMDLSDKLGLPVRLRACLGPISEQQEPWVY